MAFRIFANDVPMGVYPGTTAMKAARAFYKDAGYSSMEEAARSLDKTPTELLQELRFEEVKRRKR